LTIYFLEQIVFTIFIICHINYHLLLTLDIHSGISETPVKS